MALEDQFREIATVIRTSALADILDSAGDHAPVVDSHWLESLSGSPAFIDAAIAAGRLPSARAMADEATRAVLSVHAGVLPPDDQLFLGLEAETTLFQHLESQLGQKALDALAAAGPISFGEAAVLVMSQLQSRKSRRGQSCRITSPRCWVVTAFHSLRNASRKGMRLRTSLFRDATSTRT